MSRRPTPPSPPTSHGRSSWLRAGATRATAVGYAPILDTERGVLAGVGATPARGRSVDAEQLGLVLTAHDRLPRNTFLSVPLNWQTLATPRIQAELLRPADLRGIVFELVGVLPGTTDPCRRAVAASIQDAGGLLAVQADEIWHPDFTALTDRPPRMVIVGAQWVRRIEDSQRRQEIVATLGTVAAERDAWVLAAGVSTLAELSTLARLNVPLLSGPAVGSADFSTWPVLAPTVTAALGPMRHRPPGPMRELLVVVPTVRTLGDAAAAAVRGLPVPGAAVVLDVYGRPVGMALRTAGGVRATEDVLCVHVDTALRDATARAKARSVRDDPILAVDSAGRFLGVVSVDALAGAR